MGWVHHNADQRTPEKRETAKARTRAERAAIADAQFRFHIAHAEGAKSAWAEAMADAHACPRRHLALLPSHQRAGLFGGD